MLCQNCHKNDATVHVTEIVPALATETEGAPDTPTPTSPEAAQVHEQHLCELCSQSMNLPENGAFKKSGASIWKLLHLSALQNRRQGRRSTLACKSCGMTLEEFRRKGRLGCPECYATFGEQVEELLERVHGARRHVGRVPGVSPVDVERLQRLAELKQRLEVAVREEDYEGAANLRDRIRRIEGATP